MRYIDDEVVTTDDAVMADVCSEPALASVCEAYCEYLDSMDALVDTFDYYAYYYARNGRGYDAR